MYPHGRDRNFGPSRLLFSVTDSPEQLSRHVGGFIEGELPINADKNTQEAQEEMMMQEQMMQELGSERPNSADIVGQQYDGFDPIESDKTQNRNYCNQPILGHTGLLISLKDLTSLEELTHARTLNRSRQFVL